MQPRPNVWTCGAGLIEALAQRVLAGFPLADGAHDLSRWTILVPTRRAARALEQRLFALSGAKALLLPTVRPIADTDEDMLAETFPDARLPDAIPATGQIFLLLSLIDEWARDNPQLSLAADVQASAGQALGLAQSLAELVTQLETEEITPDFGQAFMDLDLAEHRQTIFSLLHLIQEQLPARLHARTLIGSAARRNRLLRLEAERIASGAIAGPIIAAGSTGTNPATRELLKAISRHPHGAVILPGLDLGLDDAAWESAGPAHPQFALKTLLAHLETDRGAVQDFSPPTARQQLMREVMRPAETTERWAEAEILPRATLSAALSGLRLIEAPDRQIEARSIALLLREALETPGRRAALVTPDRDLAQMVTAELGRWSATIDDSGGEPLIRFGRAQLCKLVIECVEQDFAPATLVALLSHPFVTLGLAEVEAKLTAHLFELALLRQDLPPKGPRQFSTTFSNVRRARTGDPHAPPALRRLDEAGWDGLGEFTERFAAALRPISETDDASLAIHVDRLCATLDMLAPEDAADPAHRAFADVMESLRQESPHHPVGPLHRSLFSIVWALRQETLRPQTRDDTRLAIFGLAEARMIEADLVVLAGLNEGIWPAAADPGPWINRSMRASLGLSQPERAIGVTAHDLAQGLMHSNAVLTWSRRAGKAPLMPSRWILRLRTLMEKAGLPAAQQVEHSIPALARALDAPARTAMLAMPCPAPAVHLRPTSFSVTEIERLIRDPYAIFARRVLDLSPLGPLGGSADHALRGTLFHEALRRYVEGEETALPHLLEAGRQIFAPHIEHPDVQHFWWPRFKRMAAAFVEEDRALRADVVASVVERKGVAMFDVAGVPHMLRARADRIDVTATGKARFIDYKTGTVPSPTQVETGLSPQLTLEAAILRHGSFIEHPGQSEPGREVDDLIYIRTSGGREAVEVTPLAANLSGGTIAELAEKHFEGLKRLLGQFQSSRQPYIPRAVMFKDRDVSDYDHLSRHAEWSRSGP